MEELKKKFRSLSVRLPLLFVLSGLLIMLILVPVIYVWTKNRMIADYTRMARGITNLMTASLDGNGAEEYIENNHEPEEYGEIRRHLLEIKENYPDVVYAHVLRFEGESARVVFNLQNSGEKTMALPGQSVQMYEPFLNYAGPLGRGEEVTMATEKTEDGHLLTHFRPVFDDEGRYQFHVCVAFSMEALHRQNLLFLMEMILLVGIVVALVFLVDAHVIHKNVIAPLENMSNCARNFTYDTEADRFRNVQAMEELNIQTGDEIQEVYYDFMSVMKESLYYMTNLSRAKSNIQEQEEKLDQISETAFKDALTRVGNQAAYNRMADTLGQEIADKTARFAIVMVDLNNLKYVNDTFGHKFGDSYIKGCCSIICSIYKRSPVYRVGGDEFVVVLRNEDYMSRLLRLTQITEAFMASYGQQDKEPWERYTASVGMAEFTPSDESVDQVMKRADKDMYEKKAKFKEKYGSYR